jgi:hypothetical protein
MRQSYTYVDDDRAVVTRPSGMREVQALKALRRRDVAWWLSPDVDERVTPPSSRTIREAMNMVENGWMREPSAVNEYKRKVWQENEEVVRRILRDL